MTEIKWVAVGKGLVDRIDHKGTRGNFYTLLMEAVTQVCLSKNIELKRENLTEYTFYLIELHLGKSVKDEDDVIFTSGFSR